MHEAITADEAQLHYHADLLAKVRDAKRLLDYAVEVGFRSADGIAVGENIIHPIRRMDLKLRCESISTCMISAEERSAFDLAYMRLASLLAPVTAASLQATSNSEADRRGSRFPASRAKRFSRLLWVIALLFLLFAVVGEWGLRRYGAPLDGEVDFANTLMQLSQVLIPFSFGGLGATVYLLRSAHTNIHERTFDVNREPEYLNRILLGVISGGAIVLFVNEVSDGNEESIDLSEAALGFLAGYSTEFLFQTIERISAALLPKVGLETIQRSREKNPPLQVPAGDLTMSQLVELHATAGPEDKALYRALLERIARHPGGQ